MPKYLFNVLFDPNLWEDVNTKLYHVATLKGKNAARLLFVGRVVHEVLHAAKCKKPFAEAALQTSLWLQGVSSQAGNQGPAAPTGGKTVPPLFPLNYKREVLSL